MLKHSEIERANELIREFQKLYFQVQHNHANQNLILDPQPKTIELQTQFNSLKEELRELVGEGVDAETCFDAIFKLTAN